MGGGSQGSLHIVSWYTMWLPVCGGRWQMFGLPCTMSHSGSLRIHHHQIHDSGLSSDWRFCTGVSPYLWGFNSEPPMDSWNWRYQQMPISTITGRPHFSGNGSSALQRGFWAQNRLRTSFPSFCQAKNEHSRQNNVTSSFTEKKQEVMF